MRYPTIQELAAINFCGFGGDNVIIYRLDHDLSDIDNGNCYRLVHNIHFLEL